MYWKWSGSAPLFPLVWLNPNNNVFRPIEMYPYWFMGPVEQTFHHVYDRAKCLSSDMTKGPSLYTTRLLACTVYDEMPSRQTVCNIVHDFFLWGCRKELVYIQRPFSQGAFCSASPIRHPTNLGICKNISLNFTMTGSYLKLVNDNIIFSLDSITLFNANFVYLKYWIGTFSKDSSHFILDLALARCGSLQW
jgi:hypothetical protein